MAWLSGALAGAGSILGAGLNYFGASQANEEMRRSTEKQMDFQRESAREQMGFQKSSVAEQMAFQKASNQEQMAFQERMSNTAYQRAMQDMTSAGLNPILAYNLGGASTPGGSSSSGSSAGGASSSGSSYRPENKMAGAVSSALAVRRMYADLESAKANVEATKAQTDMTRELVKGVQSENVSKAVEASIDSGYLGTALRYLARLTPGVSSAANVARLFVK